MLRVALTGGLGTGKSTVLQRWRERGVPVTEADALVHELLNAGGAAVAAIATRFGPGVLAADGAVDRGRLAALVFSDVVARQDLEAILHPTVYAAIDGWMEQQQSSGADLAVAEVPLLFETGHADDFDRVVATACEPGQQLARAAARRGQLEDVRRRIAAQWPAEEKARLAHLVIRTDGTLAETRAAADVVLDRLRAEAADEA